MIESTLMGPGWLMFFQDETDLYTWKDGVSTKKEREENEIIILLKTMYESGTFE
ncbi:MAG: hypothetical protein KAR06_03760 [Deltaproteobacteria bacterium]|nr:hypothetical protein [Deltaproteobacteria bacterium]